MLRTAPRTGCAWRVLVAVGMIGALSFRASADSWTVVNLHPAMADVSVARGVGSGQQVGYALGVVRASLWNDTAESWVSLHPSGSSQSEAYGVHAGQQVGYAYMGGSFHASLWTGSAESWVDLNPAGSIGSEARGVHRGHQVGVASVGGTNRASLWGGSAASWVDLSPAEATESYANDVYEGQQVGGARINGIYRAGLWNSSAASWVDLHPTEATFSEAYGVHGNQQVGNTAVAGIQRASLWNGIATSWVDLHPPGASRSMAYDVYGGQQVGFAEVGGSDRASLWRGAAESWVDLHSFLPPSFARSHALGIWDDGAVAYVTGWGWDMSTGRCEALMWIGPVPEPASILLLCGSLFFVVRRRAVGRRPRPVTHAVTAAAKGHRRPCVSMIGMVAVVLSGWATQASLAGVWVQWPGNGHYYQAVAVPGGITWDDAQAAAVAEGGYLATCTSGEENEFVFSLIDAPGFWNPSPIGYDLGPWLGGARLPNSEHPAVGWTWVTGEEFTFSNWYPGQPDSLLENRLHFGCPEGRVSMWNNLHESGDGEGGPPVVGYVIESPVPEPTSLSLLAVIGIGLLSRRGRGWARNLAVIGGFAVLIVAGTAGADVVIDTVPVGNPGNAGELSGVGAGGWGPDRICGSVSYPYKIGKYEVTAGQYTAFLNAVAATDTYGLYGTSMWSSEFGCKIQQIGSSGSYTYDVAPDWANRPVNFVNWGDSARFCNWLHNGQPTGAQGLSTTEDGSYFLNGALTNDALLAITRRPTATWAIPTEDEWHKAAYHKNNGVTGNYWGFPTATDSEPSNAVITPDPGNNATFYDGTHTIGSPYWRTEVGEHENSTSPYGTFDQGGNVWEWTEDTLYAGLSRLVLGGSFTSSYADIADLRAVSRDGHELPANDFYGTGFRLVQVPEPTCVALLALVGMVLRRRR